MSNDKTKWIFDDAPESTKRPNDVTETLDNTSASFDDKTIVGGDEPTVQLTSLQEEAKLERTQIYTRGNAAQFESQAGYDDDSDPITGWLVVVKGPGLGRGSTLGSGMNIVGRSAESRCALPYGDTLMSSDDHIRIIYDEDTRKFFVSHGSGKNVSRVNGEILMNTMPLTDGSVINLSKVTTVMFKAFCGEGFDWSDLAEMDKSGTGEGSAPA